MSDRRRLIGLLVVAACAPANPVRLLAALRSGMVQRAVPDVPPQSAVEHVAEPPPLLARAVISRTEPLVTLALRSLHGGAARSSSPLAQPARSIGSDGCSRRATVRAGT